MIWLMEILKIQQKEQLPIENLEKEKCIHHLKTIFFFGGGGGGGG